MAMAAERTKLLTKAEAAQELRVSTRTLDRIVACGDIIPARVGARRLVFRQQDIEEYLRKRLMDAARCYQN